MKAKLDLVTIESYKILNREMPKPVTVKSSKTFNITNEEYHHLTAFLTEANSRLQISGYQIGLEVLDSE